MTLEEWSAISEELQTLLKIKPKPDETADSLARRLAAKANKVSDEDWEVIAEPTQLWVNSVLEAMEKSEPLPLPEELALAVDEAEDDEAEPEGEAEAEEAEPADEGEDEPKPAKAKAKAAKKPAKAKAANSGEKRRVGRPSKYDPAAKIKILITDNPHRETSKDFAKFNKLKAGATVDVVITDGVDPGYLRYAEKRDFISIG